MEGGKRTKSSLRYATEVHRMGGLHKRARFISMQGRRWGGLVDSWGGRGTKRPETEGIGVGGVEEVPLVRIKRCRRRVKTDVNSETRFGQEEEDRD